MRAVLLGLPLAFAFLTSSIARAEAAPAPPPTTAAPAPAISEAPGTPPAPAAAPPAVPQRIKLLVLDVKSGDLEKNEVDTLSGFVAAHAARFKSLEVISAADLRELADLEASKQASGCDEGSSSCLAELAGALGAELVLSTRAGKLDAVYVVSLQLFDARKASAEGRASVQGWGLAELPGKIGPALDELLGQATGDTPSSSGPVVESRPKFGVGDGLRFGLQVGGGVTAGVGVVAIALGVTPALLYGQKKSELANLTRNFDDSKTALDDATRVHAQAVDMKSLYNGVGRWAVVVGGVLVAVGGGALAAGFLLPGSNGEAE